MATNDLQVFRQIVREELEIVESRTTKRFDKLDQAIEDLADNDRFIMDHVSKHFVSRS